MANENGHPVNNLFLPHWSLTAKLKGLSGIYLNVAMRNFAFGLISIFIPIYLYKITNSLVNVFLFYSIWRLIQIATTIPIAKLISRIGPDLSMLLSNLTRSIYLVLITYARTSPTCLWIAPLFGALTVPLYFLPYHTAFASESKSGRLSKQLAKISDSFPRRYLYFNCFFLAGIS